MPKPKSRFFFSLRFIAAGFALAGILMAAARYLALRPVEAYTDCGIMEFAAAEWYTRTEQAPRQGGAPAHTRSHYYVRYGAAGRDGAAFSYREGASSYEAARALARSKNRIQRRILSGGDAYLTISANRTKEQWLNQNRISGLAVFPGSAACLVILAVLIRRERCK